MTSCPRRSASRGPATSATTPAGPPGGKGTTRWIARSGKPSAPAGPPSPSKTSNTKSGRSACMSNPDDQDEKDAVTAVTADIKPIACREQVPERPKRAGFAGCRAATAALTLAAALLLRKVLAVPDQPLVRQIDTLGGVVDDAADHPGAPPVALQNGQCSVAIFLGDEHAKADPHIVDLIHFRAADTPV